MEERTRLPLESQNPRASKVFTYTWWCHKRRNEERINPVSKISLTLKRVNDPHIL
jgi:hypothetical protein